MKDKIKANKLREGKTISADQLTAELIVNPKSNKIPVNELLTGNTIYGNSTYGYFL